MGMEIPDIRIALARRPDRLSGVAAPHRRQLVRRPAAGVAFGERGDPEPRPGEGNAVDLAEKVELVIGDHAAGEAGPDVWHRTIPSAGRGIMPHRPAADEARRSKPQTTPGGRG